MSNEEQIYAVGGEISEDGLNFILDLIDDYIELREMIQKGVRDMRLRRLHYLHLQVKSKLNTHYAPVVELEDTSDLSSDGFGRESSNLFGCTKPE